MTETRQRRHKARAGDRDRLQAFLLASPEPPQDLKRAIVGDTRALETELLRARAALKQVSEAAEGVSVQWRAFAREAWEVTR